MAVSMKRIRNPVEGTGSEGVRGYNYFSSGYLEVDTYVSHSNRGVS